MTVNVWTGMMVSLPPPRVFNYCFIFLSSNGMNFPFATFKMYLTLLMEISIKNAQIYLWILDTGRECENNIQECDSTPCQNGGTCEDGIAEFSCKCPDGKYTHVFFAKTYPRLLVWKETYLIGSTKTKEIFKHWPFLSNVNEHFSQWISSRIKGLLDCFNKCPSLP